jgi:putative metallohydrolase (TIGR04338 family)
MRDTQRSKVYSAERKAFGSFEEVYSFNDCKAILSIVKDGSYYRSVNGYRHVKLKDGRGRRSACYQPDTKTIKLPKWSRNDFVIMHEIAHSLAHRTVGEGEHAGHHASFCTHYANLIHEQVGNQYAIKLINEFKSGRVLYQESKLIF